MSNIQQQVAVILGLIRRPKSGKLDLRMEVKGKENADRVFAVRLFTPGDKGAIALLERARQAVAKRPDLIWTDPTDGNNALLGQVWVGRKQYRSKADNYQSITGETYWFSIEPPKVRGFSAGVTETL